MSDHPAGIEPGQCVFLPPALHLRREDRGIYIATYIAIQQVGGWSVHLLADSWEQATAAAEAYLRENPGRFTRLVQLQHAGDQVEIVHVGDRPNLLS